MPILGEKTCAPRKPLSRDVDTVVAGIAPTREGILKLAGKLQAIGVKCEESGIGHAILAHDDCAYLVRTMQAISGLLGELAQIIENQSHEIQIQQSLPDFPKPKILMQ